MMQEIVGIVGNAKDKFTPETEKQAKRAIDYIMWLRDWKAAVSGHCHLGGIDIWAEEAAEKRGLPMITYPPAALFWEGGYKPRNMKIAALADVLYVIVAEKYPEGYRSQKFKVCYHCGNKRPAHVKSGGCWTGIQAQKLGKEVRWMIVDEHGWVTTD